MSTAGLYSWRAKQREKKENLKLQETIDKGETIFFEGEGTVSEKLNDIFKVNKLTLT
jgi:hypothetical protein